MHLEFRKMTKNLPKSLFFFFAAFMTFWNFRFLLFVNQPDICLWLRPVSFASCCLSLFFRYGCWMLSRNHFCRILVWSFAYISPLVLDRWLKLVESRLGVALSSSGCLPRSAPVWPLLACCTFPCLWSDTRRQSCSSSPTRYWTWPDFIWITIVSGLHLYDFSKALKSLLLAIFSSSTSRLVPSGMLAPDEIYFTAMSSSMASSNALFLAGWTYE